jgi:hypothetical protein
MLNATSFTPNGGGVSKNNAPYLGFDLAYGGNLFRWGQAHVGWELGFGILPINITDSHSLSGTFTQTTNSFSTDGIAIPPAPYQGSPSGGPTILTNLTTLGNSSTNGTLTGTRTLDVTLYSLRLGPTLYWPLHPKIAVQANAGFAVAVVSGEYKYNETAVIGSLTTHNTGSFGATDVTYGGTAGATLLYHVVENGDFYIGAQFMSLGNTTFSGQGRQARLDLGAGVLLSAGINWPF